MTFKQSPKTKSAPDQVTFAQMGAILGLSAERIRQLHKNGTIPASGEKGMVVLYAGVQGYIKFIGAESARSVRSSETTRIQRAKARKLELELALKTKDLMYTDEAFNTLTTVYGVIKSEFNAMPARITRDIAMRDQFERHIDTVWNTVADLMHRESERHRGLIREADEEDEAA